MHLSSYIIFIIFIVLMIPSTALAIPPAVVLAAAAGVLAPIKLISSFIILPFFYFIRSKLRIFYLFRNYVYIAFGCFLFLLGFFIAAKIVTTEKKDVSSIELRKHQLFPNQLVKKIYSSKPPILVDIRRWGGSFYSDWHLLGAKHIERNIEERLTEYLDSIPPESDVILYCYGGLSSQIYLKKLIQEQNEKGLTNHNFYFVFGGAWLLRRLESHTNLHFRSVRNVSSRYTGMWAEEGSAVAYQLDHPFTSDNQIDILNSFLRSSDRPVAIYLSETLRQNGVTPDTVESKIEFQRNQPHFYAFSEESSWLFEQISSLNLRLKQLSGNPYHFILFLFLIELFILGYVRYRWVFGQFPGKRNRWEFIYYFIPVFFTLFIAAFSYLQYEFHGLSMNDAVFFSMREGSPISLINAVLACFSIWFYINFPLRRRTEDLIRFFCLTAAKGSASFRLTPDRSFVFLSGFLLGPVTGFFINKPTFLHVCYSLVIPLFIDVILVRFIFPLMISLNRKPISILVKAAGYDFIDAPVASELTTYVNEYPGRFHYETPAGNCFIGFGDCNVFPCSDFPSSLPDPKEWPGATTKWAAARCPTKTSLKNEMLPVSNTEARRLVDIGLHFRSIMDSDLTIFFNESGQIVNIKVITAEGSISQSIHDTVISQISLSDQTPEKEVILDSVAFAEVVQHPTPLTLEVIRGRWEKGGAAIKALRSFGVFIKKQNLPENLIVPIGRKLYKNLKKENQLFNGNHKSSITQWLLYFSIKTTLKALKLKQNRCYIMEKQRGRTNYLQQLAEIKQSNRSLIKIIIKGLKRLSRTSALWQEKISLMHQYLYNELKAKEKDFNYDLTDLLSAIFPRRAVSANLFPYELKKPDTNSCHKQANTKSFSEYPESIRVMLALFATAEQFKQEVRETYLDELAAVTELLNKLGEQTELGEDIFFLRANDLSKLKNRKQIKNLSEKAKENRKQWREISSINLPAQITYQDVDQICLLPQASKEKINISGKQPVRGLWVSSTRKEIKGIARVFTGVYSNTDYRPGDILIAPLISPEKVLACSAAKALVIEQGGILCHSAIIARELGISTIMNAHNATKRIKEGDHIELKTDGTVNVLRKELPLWDSLDRVFPTPLIGNKAARLAILRQEKYPVPGAMVLTHKALEEACISWGVPLPDQSDRSFSPPPELSSCKLPDTIRDEITRLLKELTVPETGLIIRSSSTLEDNPDFSYAGVFNSYKTTDDFNDIIATICKAWLSLWGSHIHYPSGNSDMPVRLNLIIQHYIPSKLGGVIFTNNPQDAGSSHIALEISENGPDAVTRGEGYISRIISTRDGNIINQSGSKNILSSVMLKRLCKLAIDIENEFSRPQDIEWLIDKGDIYILQSRDIKSARAP